MYEQTEKGSRDTMSKQKSKWVLTLGDSPIGFVEATQEEIVKITRHLVEKKLLAIQKEEGDSYKGDGVEKIGTGTYFPVVFSKAYCGYKDYGNGVGEEIWVKVAAYDTSILLDKSVEEWLI